MSDDVQFRIGNRETEHIVVRVLGRERSEAKDYWDGNWVDARVRVAAGGFRGELGGALRTEGFVRLRNQLRLLGDDPAGNAKFETMEDWLSIAIVGDGKGHFHAACAAVDVRTANRLTFGLDFDQAELPEILCGLDAVCEAWPVVGKP